MTAFFRHSCASGFLVWGFRESRHGIPNGALYRTDWSPRPAAKVWRELVFTK